MYGAEVVRKGIFWIVCCAAVFGIVYTGYLYFRPVEEISYPTAAVRNGDIEKTVAATGDITPLLLVDVGVQVSGQIKGFYVRLGQQVEKGDLIAEIDSSTQFNELQRAKAQLKSYQAQLVSKKISLEAASRNFTREKSLLQKEATSRKEFDTAEESLASVRSEISTLEASIKQAEIAVATAETNIGYTKIVAPMSGTVVSTAIEEGQTVNSVQSSPTIVQIADLTKVVNRMQVGEGDITRIHPGMEVKFTTLADPKRERHGVIRSVDPGLTAMSRGGYTSRTDLTATVIYYYARAVVENEDGRLRIGMTTENSIVVEEAKDVLIIPTLAVRHGADGTYVDVLKDGVVEERAIVTGLANALHTEVRSGLAQGEDVISNPGPSLPPGAAHAASKQKGRR